MYNLQSAGSFPIEFGFWLFIFIVVRFHRVLRVSDANLSECVTEASTVVLFSSAFVRPDNKFLGRVGVLSPR